MAKLLFVHGTGVREPAYSESFREVVAGARRAQLGVEPERCYWGGAQGVRLLAGGASIPNYDGVVDHVRGWELHDDFALWSLLYDDPQYELRLLAERPKPKLALAPGQRTPSEVLAGALLDARALRPHFDQALASTPSRGSLVGFAPNLSKVLTRCRNYRYRLRPGSPSPDQGLSHCIGDQCKRSN
jgi:hypothetical protein